MKDAVKKWYETDKSDTDVILSTFVRIYRNFDGIPFPSRMTDDQKERVDSLVSDALRSAGFAKLRADRLPRYALVALAERGIASPDYVDDPSGKLVFLSEDESVAVLTNGTDHVELLGRATGPDTRAVYAKLRPVEQMIGKAARFAFSDRYGYLREDLTAVGTGVVPGVTAHLPALEYYDRLRPVAAALSKTGIAIAGQNIGAKGNPGSVYVIDNRVGLGLGEGEQINNLSVFALQTATEEKRGSEAMAKSGALADKTAKALDYLYRCTVLSYADMEALLSHIRLGVREGLSSVSLSLCDKLSNELSPAYMSVAAGRRLERAERDVLRAQIVKQAMSYKNRQNE